MHFSTFHFITFSWYFYIPFFDVTCTYHQSFLFRVFLLVFLLLFLYSIWIKNPTDATVCRYLFAAKSLYIFRVSQHPSAGVLKTVPAASGTGHTTCTATPLQRGLIGTPELDFLLTLNYDARNHELKCFVIVGHCSNFNNKTIKFPNLWRNSISESNHGKSIIKIRIIIIIIHFPWFNSLTLL